MTHKIVHTDNYLLIMDTSKTDPFDSSKVGYPIAHLPLNGSPILEGVPILPPYSRHQEDGLDDAVIRFKESWIKLGVTDFELSAFSEGYNKAREKYKYTEEDMRKAIDMATTSKHDSTLIFFNAEEIIQYLHQYPTEFECEMVDFTVTKEVDYSITYSEHEPKPKTITTAQGVQWVGKYK